MTSLLLLISSGIVVSIKQFYAKILMSNGLSVRRYAFALILGMPIFSVLLFLYYDFQLNSITFIIFLLIFAVAFIRIFNLLASSDILNRVSPLEVNAYKTLTIIATFFIDAFLLRSLNFSFMALAMSFIIIGSVFFMIKGNRSAKSKSAVISIIITILSTVLMGYAIYFITQHLNVATYLFTMSLLSLILVLPFIKRFEFDKSLIPISLKVQSIGVLNLIVSTTLAYISPTYYMLTIPVRMSFLIIISYYLKNKVNGSGAAPSKSQYVFSIIILIAVLLKAYFS